MNRACRLLCLRRLITALGTLMLGLSPHLSMAADTCASTAEQAAERFVAWSLQDAPRTTELIEPRNLQQFRARLEQIMDDRYAPDAAPFRERILGTGWTRQRMAAASDRELVGQFLAGGEAGRRDWRISDVRAIESRRDAFGGREVVVSYRVETPQGATAQRRDFTAHLIGACWLVQVPIETWARLDRIGEILKRSRDKAGTPRQGPSRVTLQVAAASDTPRDGMRQLARRGGSMPVWVATQPLLTQADVVAARAAWDCDPAGLGPEDPAVWLTFSPDAAAVLRRWTEANMGSMLALVVDEQVVVYARVAAALGADLSMCLPGESLEKAQGLAAGLVGAPR